jgi:hypothetical protein
VVKPVPAGAHRANRAIADVEVTAMRFATEAMDAIIAAAAVAGVRALTWWNLATEVGPDACRATIAVDACGPLIGTIADRASDLGAAVVVVDRTSVSTAIADNWIAVDARITGRAVIPVAVTAVASAIAVNTEACGIDLPRLIGAGTRDDHGNNQRTRGHSLVSLPSIAGRYRD